MVGLHYRSLVGVAVAPGDVDTVVVSAARGPSVSYYRRGAEAYVYRRSGSGPFVLAMDGLPAAEGTVASHFATHVTEPGAFYAANNHGLFRSNDAGRSWQELPITWPEGVFPTRVNGIVVLRE